MPPPVLLGCDGLSKAFGANELFKNLTFHLYEGDHVGLIGPNGTGKSTLLKILAGLEAKDGGEIHQRKGLRVGYVPQDPVFAAGKSAEEVVIEAIDDPSLEEHERFKRAVLALGKAGFEDREIATDTLSGGWRKRLGIACQLAAEPDVLLLDEPTNHLDVESIVWLEGLLKAEPEAFIVISHDRYFLNRICRRILELDRRYPEGLLQATGSYVEFLEARDQLLAQQAAYRDSLANLVRREIEWLRRGPKARTTKSKARIDKAGTMIDELGNIDDRSRTSTAGIDFSGSGRKTKRLWSCSGLAKSFGELVITRGLDLDLMRRDRLGILGANGSGKSTLLKMIIGELEPDAGSIRSAEHLRIVYFEQNRESLDPELTLERALAPEGDSVVYGDREIHVASWARRFLFGSDRLRAKIGSLSGGEKARVVIARLMLQPADLLVLDEPTNDLDIPTLDVLEEALEEFAGALVLVTHDRFLLDRLTSRVLGLDGEGGAEFFADCEQWLDFRAAQAKAHRAESKAAAAKAARPRAKKLGYLEQRELEGMEGTVLEAEAELEAAQAAAADPAIAADGAALVARHNEVAAAEAKVESLYERWTELEEKQS